MKRPVHPTSNQTEVPTLTLVYTFDTENAEGKWEAREETGCWGLLVLQAAGGQWDHM